MKYATGAFVASLALIASYVWGPSLLSRLLSRGDSTDWGDCCKQPTWREMTGRLPNE